MNGFGGYFRGALPAVEVSTASTTIAVASLTTQPLQLQRGVCLAVYVTPLSRNLSG